MILLYNHTESAKNICEMGRILKIFKVFQPHISKIFECISQFELKLIKQGTNLMSSIMYNPKSLEYSTYAKEYYQYSNARTSSQ